MSGKLITFFIQFSILFLFILFSVSCDAETEKTNTHPEPIVEVKSLPNSLGTYRHITFLPSNIELYAVTLNDNYHAELQQQETKTQFFAKSLLDVGHENNAIVSVNGGFYSPDFKPIGLFIQNNKILGKPSKGKLLTSCLRIDSKRKIFLEKEVANCLRAKSALQTGLILINQGSINSNLNFLQNNSIKLKAYFDPHRRTILAQSNNNKLLIIVTSPVTLPQLANILKENPKIFGVNAIKMALNLDGGSSTGMYVRLEQTPFYFSEIKPVQNFLLFY